MASTSFQRMSHDLYETNWYHLPIETQKSFVVMIKNAQKPIYYHGFGVAILDLELFRRVSTFALRHQRDFKNYALFWKFHNEINYIAAD